MSEINQAFILKLIKFGAVGVSGTLIDFGITYFFREKVKINEYVANTLGFFTAATNNFVLNRMWTFQSSDPEVTFQYFRFLLIATIGVVFSNAIIYVLHGRLKWNFYMGKLISVGVVLFWNFFANYFFTFK